MTPSEHHKHVNSEGVGKCSVPMWMGGLPAGFCDEPAYGPQEKGQLRYGNWEWGRFTPGYCSGLACHNHGGPKCEGALSKSE